MVCLQYSIFAWAISHFLHLIDVNLLFPFLMCVRTYINEPGDIALEQCNSDIYFFESVPLTFEWCQPVLHYFCGVPVACWSMKKVYFLTEIND